MLFRSLVTRCRVFIELHFAVIFIYMHRHNGQRKYQFIFNQLSSSNLFLIRQQRLALNRQVLGFGFTLDQDQTEFHAQWLQVRLKATLTLEQELCFCPAPYRWSPHRVKTELQLGTHDPLRIRQACSKPTHRPNGNMARKYGVLLSQAAHI